MVNFNNDDDDDDDMVSVISNDDDSTDFDDCDNYDKILNDINQQLENQIESERHAVLNDNIQPLLNKLNKVVYKYCSERAYRIITIINSYIKLDNELKNAHLSAVRILFKELVQVIDKDMKDTALEDPIDYQLHYLCQSVLTLKPEELCDRLRKLSLSFEKIRSDKVLKSKEQQIMDKKLRNRLDNELDSEPHSSIADQKIKKLLSITSESCKRALEISGLTLLKSNVENLVYLIRYKNANMDTIQEKLLKLITFYNNDYKKRAFYEK